MRRLLSTAFGVAVLAAAGSAGAAVINGDFETAGGGPFSATGSGFLGNVAVGWNANNNTPGTTSTEELSSTDPFGPAGGRMMHVTTDGLSNGIYQTPISAYGSLSADFYVLSGTAWLISALDGATVDSGLAQVTTTALNTWQHLTINYQGGNEAVLYSFGAGADFYVDNVVTGDFVEGAPLTSVESAGVPEPASWAIMLTGLGLSGMALRRRSRAALATSPCA